VSRPKHRRQSDAALAFWPVVLWLAVSILAVALMGR
jgi:hypothetical protein